MNAALKAKHMDELKTNIAQITYDRLCTEKGEALTDTDQETIAEIAKLYEHQQELVAETADTCNRINALLAKLNA